jgi:2-methylisocitrate lyase-like PEP mutase family enzyme
MATQAQKAADFAALHQGEPFVIPNPWDGGTAMVLEALGFSALATTSAGMAFALGRPDDGVAALMGRAASPSDAPVTLDDVVGHVRLVTAASELPVSVDLENGHGPEPADVATAITRVAEAGAVGGSIEDYDPETKAIYETAQAAERVAAAREAADALPFPFVLTGRAENFVHGNPDLDDTIARLKAYEEAGADVLYAPALQTPEQIKAVADAVGKPINVLARPHLSMKEIADAGGQRVSVGASLTWVAVSATARAAERIRDQGDFSALAPPKELLGWLSGLYD